MRADSKVPSARSRNAGCRITDGIFFGEISAVVIENEVLRLTILAGRGADVVECLYKPSDLDLTWLTQWGIPTKPVPSDYPPDVDSFLNGYPGGWQSIFPNGGAPCTVGGVDFAQHDEVSLLPWDHEVITDRVDEVAVRFTVKTRKTPFLVSKIFRLRTGSVKCEITEEIENLSANPQDAMWGFHISFGGPFLAEGSKISLASGAEVIPHDAAIASTGRRVGSTDRFSWPMGRGEDGAEIDFATVPKQGTKSEMLYIVGLTDGWYQVTNPKVGLGVRVSWDVKLLPYLWYWQEYGSSSEYPWYGRHYNIGLEPFSSYPTNGLGEAIANGSALRFAPFERKSSTIGFEVVRM